VSTNIERLRYYDGEYLRSFDFDAEQKYHLEMRRRLNLALHLDGIVDGLRVVVPKDATEGPAHVTPGMAIDGFGRELLLFAPVPIAEDLFAENGGIQAGRDYSVWLVYDRQPGTPPSPGYRTCRVRDQSTRWVETARVVLSANLTIGPNSATASPDGVLYPDAPPGVTARLSDDPDGFPWAVYLGAVRVGLDPANHLQVTADKTAGAARRYVGVRAQRVIAADNTRRIDVLDELRAAKNLLVGDDFPVDPGKVQPPPTANPFPPDTGNVKVAGDLFLQGNLYAFDGTEKWLGLPGSVANLLPEIQVGVVTPDITPAVKQDGAGHDLDPSTDAVTVSITPRQLTTVSRGDMIVALSGLKSLGPANHANLFANLLHAQQPTEISVKAVPPSDWTLRPVKFQVQWTVGPVGSPALAPAPRLDVTQMTVSYVAILYP
jgi:hypothetical protein